MIVNRFKRNYVLHENKPLQTDNYGHLINFIAHYHRELIKLTAITCRNFQKYTNFSCFRENPDHRVRFVYLLFFFSRSAWETSGINGKNTNYTLFVKLSMQVSSEHF